MPSQIQPFMIIGKNARTGSVVKKLFRAKTETLAEATAQAEGILVDQIDAIHQADKVSGQEAPSALSRNDWSRLEYLIARCVFRGVLYLFIAWAVIAAILAYVVAAVT
jgi:hypothetical protein